MLPVLKPGGSVSSEVIQSFFVSVTCMLCWEEFDKHIMLLHAGIRSACANGQVRHVFNWVLHSSSLVHRNHFVVQSKLLMCGRWSVHCWAVNAVVCNCFQRCSH